MPDFDTSVPHIARVYDSVFPANPPYVWAARTTLVKWFRQSRTAIARGSYRHFSGIIRK
jgi:hypothetical protein